MGLSFSHVNEMLLCSSALDKQILFYDIQANKLVKSLTCEAPLRCLDFMNDGFTVAAGCSNGKVLVYDLRALTSGATPLSTITLDSSVAVCCVKFQHAPPARSNKAKPNVSGKENSAPRSGSTDADPAPAPPQPATFSRKDSLDPAQRVTGVLSPAESQHPGSRRSTLEAGGIFSPAVPQPSSTLGPSTVFSPVVDASKAPTPGLRMSAEDMLLLQKRAEERLASQSPAPRPVRVEKSREELINELERVKKDRQLQGNSDQQTLSPSVGLESELPPPPARRSNQNSGQKEEDMASPYALGTKQLSSEYPATPQVPSFPSASSLLVESRSAVPGTPQPLSSSAQHPNDVTSLIQAAIQQASEQAAETVRAEVGNLHLDMIRQFHIQQSEIRQLREDFGRREVELQVEVRELRAEVARLKHVY
mmetsp:Transcript_8699/g.13769  ORF Transcript_8699/g.13769 Transcript_8699/m.13769 type:complete len:421 (+) Transcript_8699:2-1264(+)